MKNLLFGIITLTFLSFQVESSEKNEIYNVAVFELTRDIDYFLPLPPLPSSATENEIEEHKLKNKKLSELPPVIILNEIKTLTEYNSESIENRAIYPTNYEGLSDTERNLFNSLKTKKTTEIKRPIINETNSNIIIINPNDKLDFEYRLLGKLTLSNIEMRKETACLYYEYENLGFGYGGILFLEKTKNIWRIKKRIRMWIT